MKAFIQKIRKEFAIFFVSKRCKELDYLNATYRVLKVTNDNGLELYEIYMTVNDFERQICGFGKATLEEAKTEIDRYKKWCKEEYNRKHTRKVEWINVC